MGSIVLSYCTKISELYVNENTVPQQNMHTFCSDEGVCSKHITIFNWSQEMNQNNRSLNNIAWRQA
jgi:hypothetical protein